MYVTTWPETWPHWLSASRLMFIFVRNNSLHLAITGRSCETTSRALHAGAAFQCGIIIPGSTSSCALLDGRASSPSGLNNSCIRGPPCRHPLAGGSAKEEQWYFKVLLKSGSQHIAWLGASWRSISARGDIWRRELLFLAPRATTLSIGGH